MSEERFIASREWERHEAEEAYWRWERATRRRLRRQYGAGAVEMIAALVERALGNHPGMPEKDAWRWAEAKYERGEVLC